VAHLCHYLVRAGRAVIRGIEGLLEDIADDTLVQRGLEADLGLPPGALDRVKDKDKNKDKKPDLTGIEDYIDDVDADAEKLALALEGIAAYAKFWLSVFEAAREEDASILVDEALYRLYQSATVELLKYEQPGLYAFARLVGVIGYDVRTAVEETFAPEAAAGVFTKSYWEDEFGPAYVNFRLDQAPDFVRADPEDAATDEARTLLRQLDARLFGLSDGAFGVVNLIDMFVPFLGDVEQIYGWELPRRPPPPPCIGPPPGTGIPISDHIASRAWTMRVRPTSGPAGATSAALTQLLFREADGRLGWLLSLRGAVTFEEKAGSEERPVKIKVKVEAKDGLDAGILFSGDDRFRLGAPTGGMSLAIEPAQPAAAGPAFSLPDASGTRLEIGDFSFSVDISPDGFKIKASARKSAFVLSTGEADAFVKEAVGSRETRAEFDLGLTVDQNGISTDGGGRLALTIPLNVSTRFVKLNTLQLALNPAASERASELQWSALLSFGLTLGPLRIVVEQIGVTLDLGSSRDVPDDALELIPPSLLYARNLGFRPPSGIGISVESDLVSGGGFLFYDRDNEEYAGVLHLDFGRFAFTAIGLLTTRLPEGGEGYSLLIVLSLEIDPPWPIGPIRISGLGGLFGLRRALNTEALRAGLRNRTLDAILFPKDPIANAGSLVASLRTVFPPARDKHVAGPILQLAWGFPILIRAELALVFEWGASSRRALMGQLHSLFEIERSGGKPPLKVLELNVDAVGIWDNQSGDFSLDATIYDSHLLFIALSGDVALRMKRGEFFLFSAGGYHPEFAVPANFPKLERLQIKFIDEPNCRLTLRGYIAVSSNTKQLGAEVDFYGKAGSVTFEARLSLDLLWGSGVTFIFDFDLEFKIKYKSKTLFGVSVSGRMSGSTPKRIQGEWSVDLWLFSIGGTFDFTRGDDAPPAALPQTEPMSALVAALGDQRNWSAPLPQRSRQLVTFRGRPGSVDVLVHPLGELGVRQQVLPLETELDLFAGGVPQGERRFTITKAFLGEDPVPGLRPTNEHFAAADFLELTDDEKLGRPSFEEMPAGVTLTPKALGFGGEAPGTANHAADSEIDFEEIVIDAHGNTVREDEPKGLSDLLTLWGVGFGPAARSPLRTEGTARYATPSAGLKVGPERFAVVGVSDLAPVQVDGAAPSGLSHAAVTQALERHLAENPEQRGSLQVVAAFKSGAAG
jgi:hypothetical protein